MSRRARWSGGVLLALALTAVSLIAWARSNDATADAGPLIAAATDLRPVMPSLQRAFAGSSGRPAGRVTFGPSGQLAEQIAEGAPYDLLLAAAPEPVHRVVRAGRASARTQRVYALGPVAIWSRFSPVGLDQLGTPAVRRIAIANPRYAPYGAAAARLLTRAGLTAATQRKLVYAPGVADALAMARSGNADVALVSLALARAAGGATVPIAASLAPPLRQTLVVTTTGQRQTDATRFAQFLGSRTARRILQRAGYELP